MRKVGGLTGRNFSCAKRALHFSTYEASGDAYDLRSNRIGISRVTQALL